MPAVTVYKLDLQGRVTWQYEGQVLGRDVDRVVLEAFFNREDAPFMGVTLKRGDRFVETFYSERWYNIFEIHDRDDDRIKGWYCNVGKPAVIADGSVSYVDLALDLWVAADGTQTVLDEDEFEALGLDDGTKEMALGGGGGGEGIFSPRILLMACKRITPRFRLCNEPPSQPSPIF